MNKEEFMKSMTQKQTSLTAINAFLRQSCEFEIPTRNDHAHLTRNLQGIGLGRASSGQVNDGNGWNADTHCDGGDANDGNVPYYALETSTSPFHAVNYTGIKAEFERIMAVYLEAAGGVRHSRGSSTHTHTSIGYGYFDGYNTTSVLDLPARDAYRNLGMFFVRFLPVFKWLSMTCPNGGRGAHGNSYDCLDGDQLYDWYFDRVRDVGGHSSSTDSFLQNMQRASMLRIYRSDVFHFENRMMDCNFSATMMAAWFALNRAVALWAIDMARNGYQWHPLRNDVTASRQVAVKHAQGWKHVPKAWIVENWTLMKSYLYKYFKIANSLDAIEVLEKLIDCPIPQYLEENNITGQYDLTRLENHFNVRLRERDEELRGKYLEAIKTMVVPMAASLNDFHMNVAAFLGVQQKQAVSLYQMFKRENVDIEFMAGRLVYMGE
jgi:hypothetical protein